MRPPQPLKIGTRRGALARRRKPPGVQHVYAVVSAAHETVLLVRGHEGLLNSGHAATAGPNW